MLLILSILHVFIYIFYRLFLITSSEGEFSCIIKVFKWVINKFYFIMTFGYYIRNGLELTQIMLISSLNEIYNFNTENGVEILSLLFAFFVLFLCFFTLGLSFYLALTSYKIISTEHNLLGDFFEGLKSQRKFKLYTCIFLIRRIVYIFLLIILSSTSSRLLLSILSIFQIGYLVYVIILRPFEGIKSNIIEIMNEIYFFLLLFSLVFLQTENNWSSMITDLYVWVLASNSIAVFLIVIVDGCRSIIIWLKNKCTKSKSQDGAESKVAPRERSQIEIHEFREEAKSITYDESSQTPNLNNFQEESKSEKNDRNSVSKFQIKFSTRLRLP